MKKLASFVIIGILLLGGVGAATVSKTTTSMEQTETLIFSDPELFSKESTTYVSIENTENWVNTPGAPMLPISVKTYTFPFGTIIRKVEVSFTREARDERRYIFERLQATRRSFVRNHVNIRKRGPDRVGVPL